MHIQNYLRLWSAFLTVAASVCLTASTSMARNDQSIVPFIAGGLLGQFQQQYQQQQFLSQRQQEIGRQQAIAAWNQLGPAVLSCFRQGTGIDGTQQLGYAYGISPGDNRYANWIQFCLTTVTQQQQWELGLGGEQQHQLPSATPVAKSERTEGQGEATWGSSPLYEKGLADRARWEQWVSGLTGDYKEGAEYWAGQRSLPQPRNCDQKNQAFYAGCIEAKSRLDPTDVLRNAEPAYKVGWNNFQASASPSPDASSQQAHEGQVNNSGKLVIQQPNPEWPLRGLPPPNATASAATLQKIQEAGKRGSGWNVIWSLSAQPADTRVFSDSIIMRTHCCPVNTRIDSIG
jgi:hypothetical protein